MRMTLCITLGAAWLAGAGGTNLHRTTTTYRAAADSTDLARELLGNWKGTRYESGSLAPHQFTMKWNKAPDGHLSGTVDPAAGPAYMTRVVWSADTGFVSESAPHQSQELQEEVVTRIAAHLYPDSLSGKFEIRPMTFRGRSVTGNFTAVRQK
jgi:hypothetical protein